MERLTIPDKKIDGGTRRTVIDPRKVKEYAMTIYWALKKYEDTDLTPEQIMELKHRDTEEEITETQSYGVYFYECPICNEPIHEKDNYCCKCGQRLKRKEEN